jgi:3-hydroxyacyl-CoA dehydrogenase/enoyl-CoA hydratase/3-hydroxybutyryl-CoA epimerase
MSYIKLKKDADGIVELIFDQAGEKVNKMGDAYIAAMSKAVDDLVKMKDKIKGVYVRSGKDTFFGGGDLNMLLDMPTQMDEKDATFQIQWHPRCQKAVTHSGNTGCAGCGRYQWCRTRWRL